MRYPKLTGILSICRKAGKLILGFDPTKEALEKKKVCCVLTAADISPKTNKEVCYFCEKYSVPVSAMPLTKDDMERLVGRKTAVAAVTDSGFSNRIRQLCMLEQNTTTDKEDIAYGKQEQN